MGRAASVLSEAIFDLQCFPVLKFRFNFLRLPAFFWETRAILNNILNHTFKMPSIYLIITSNAWCAKAVIIYIILRKSINMHRFVFVSKK